MLVGVSFGGLLGGLVAIPIAGCARILLLDFLQRTGRISAAVVDEAVSPTKSEYSK